jgi:hypothetical protein
MPDLNLGPAQERNRTPAILISIVVLAAIAAAIYYFSPRTPAQIQVQKVDLFAPHTETKAAKGGVHVLGTPGYAEDNLYVIVHVSLKNNLRLPLFLDSPAATLTTADGTVAATVVSPADAPRLEQSFPALTPLAPNPIGGGSEIAPRATADGSIILLFSTLTDAAWKSKKSATLTINLTHYGPQQTIDLP